MTFEYIELGDTDAARGASATAGMENANGTVAVPLNYNKPWLRSGTAFRADVPAVLRGRVTDLDSGQPMAGITVYAEREDGPQPRTTTGSDGHYTLRLPYGSHRMVATAADYAPVTGDASLTVQQPQGTLDLVLDRNAVAGKVTDYLGRAVADAEITTNGVAERMLRTGTDGTYRIAALPPGELTVTVQADGCHETGIRTEAVECEEQLDFQLGQRKDGGGYTCTTSTGTALPVTTKLALTGDEEAAEVQLPFSFPFYGTTQNQATISTNGVLTFDYWAAGWANRPLPDKGAPDGGIYAFWDDLELDQDSSVWTGTVGEGAAQKFVVEWRNSGFFAGSERITVQAVLHKDGTIVYHYRDLEGEEDALGDYASIGIEAPDNTIGFGWSYGRPVLENNLAIIFRH
ncbi:carboxypeptidase-like regulatory domain-containing protein [Streptomyces canus]|uniref:carboxypeptidase-like regulatory domain-containing protein n=1 Tax=Streptomyces canus TaxID=58343 RepID=UPI002789A572|nr:carboxypeptidase-like regulatory domain-containing protein [Streptomyces canus]MDQ1067499.1 hypothetical protein [Streptomyces canus]